MKISWGTGIVLSFVVFITASVTGALIFMNQDVALVTEDYYSKELEYQQQIDKMQRAMDLDEQVLIELKASNVVFQFPKSFLQESITGEVLFYRPSDSTKDFRLSLNLDEDGFQYISTESLTKGFWRAQLSWTMNNEDYYIEKALSIN